MSTMMQEREQRRFNLWIQKLLLIISLSLLIACNSAISGGQNRTGELTKMSQLLESQIQAVNGDARETASALGPQAFPVLGKYYKEGNELQRALTLECLAEIKDDKSIQALALGLEDESLDVRYTAVKLLHSNHSSVIGEKLKELLVGSSDPWVRGNSALILGKLDVRKVVKLLQRQKLKETDPKALNHINLALARLDDGEEREKALAHLQQENARKRYDAIADFEYYATPKLIPHLLPLLQDKTEAVNIGTEPFPEMHRICDRALDALHKILPGRLGFVSISRAYSDDELGQAIALAKQFK